jgi:hypothetical protein
VVAAVVVAGILLPRLIDAESFRPRIEAAVQRSTGWSAELGEIGFSVVRGLVLTVEPLSLRAPGGSGTTVNVRLLEVRASLWTLLQGELRVNAIELVEPVAELLRDDPGKPWLAPLPAVVPAAERGGPVDVSVGRIEIRDGRIRLEDTSGDLPWSIALADVDAWVDPGSGTGAGSATIDGGGQIEWERTGERLPGLDVRFRSLPVSLLSPWVATQVLRSEGSLDGEIALTRPEELTGVVRGTGLKVLAGERALEDVDAKFSLRSRDGDWSLTGLQIRSGELEVEGRGTLAPDLRVRLEIPRTPLTTALDVSRRLLPLPVEPEGAGEVTAVVELARADGGPLTYTVAGRASAEKVKAADFLPPVHDMRCEFTVDRAGRLTISISEATLAGGPLEGRLRLAPVYPPGRFEFDGEITGAGLGGLLAGFVNDAEKTVAGPTDARVSLGADLRELGVIDLAALSGTVEFRASEVALPGWNLREAIYRRIGERLGRLGELSSLVALIDPELARKLGDAADPGAQPGEGKSEERLLDLLSGEVRLGGSPWTIEELTLAAGAVAAAGGGKIDPTRGEVDLRLDALLAADETGALLGRYPQIGGLVRSDGRLAVPLGVRGPLTDPAVEVELGALRDAALRAVAPGGDDRVEAAKRDLEREAKEKARGLLEGLLKKGGRAEPESPPSTPEGEEQRSEPQPAGEPGDG